MLDRIISNVVDDYYRYNEADCDKMTSTGTTIDQSYYNWHNQATRNATAGKERREAKNKARQQAMKEAEKLI